MAGTSIKRLKKPFEQAYLEREATKAKRAMQNSLVALRTAANPITLVRAHPIAAAILIGGAAAVTVAVVARGRGRDEETNAQRSTEPCSGPRHGVLMGMWRAIGSGLLSLFVTKLMADSSRASGDEPDTTVE